MKKIRALLCIAFLLGPSFGAVASGVSSGNFVSGVISARGVRVPFFSSVTGERFAILAMDSVDPARQKIGPFAMAKPGYDIGNLRLEILAWECERGDWEDLLEVLQALREQAKGEFGLLLPNGGESEAVRLLGVRRARATFQSEPAGPTETSRRFVIWHDGERLRTDSVLLSVNTNLHKLP